MDAIAKSIGGLLLGAVPTMVFFIVLVIAYGFLVRRPLDAVLAERRKRTSGAVEQARSAMSAAEAETAVFEDKLRAARAEIYAARDQRLAKWAAEREAMLAEARALTAAKINGAKAELERSTSEARTQIEAMSGELSAKILRAVLPAGVAQTEATQ
jgi:F-type H+-transporting ATPase subunit b